MGTENRSAMFVISIMSKDRVGIIAEVSQKISELNGNIADIRQSVLCGYFTMILLVSYPLSVSQASIEKKLDEINAVDEPHLAIAVKPAVDSTPIPAHSFPENTYVLTVTGKDQVGFVAAVSAFCSAHEINILDLTTTIKSDQYVMILFIDLNKTQGIENIRKDLAAFSDQMGFRVVLQHYNIFRAVNEINLPAV